MEPTPDRLDRACSALVATAADALAAPHEFGPPLAADHPLAMTGGGPWAPGEWTDDTAMAMAEVVATRAAGRLHAQAGRTAGNGSLMRTAPVALALLHDEDGLVEAATQISELTHFDPEAGDACVLWCLAIRRAVLTGELDVRAGLARLDADRRAVGSAH